MVLAIAAPQIAQTRPKVQFRVSAELVMVDLRALDSRSHPVQGLKASDFEILEDGIPQKVDSFREILLQPSPAAASVESRRLIVPHQHEDVEIPLDKVAEHRLWILLFNLAGMETDQVIQAVDSARKFIRQTMTLDDLVAVLSFTGELRLVSNLTNDRDLLLGALDKMDKISRQQEANIPSQDSTGSTDNDDLGEFIADDTEFAIFDTNRQLVSLQSVLQLYKEIPARKALLYFSAGIQQNDTSNLDELRLTSDLANRTNTSIYAVDTRGLVALAPGGGARERGPRGTAIFTGQAVNDQLTKLANTQEMMQALSKDTGGKALVDNNDFQPAFTQARDDSSHYYLLGYYSSQTRKDGRFRKIVVRSRVPNLKLVYRRGYNAPKPFQAYNSKEKDELLERAIVSREQPQDFAVDFRADYFYQSSGQVLVPLSLKFSKKDLLADGGTQKQKLDLVGFARDSQGQVVQVLRDSIELSASGLSPAVLYQNAFMMNPGIYTLTFFARENRDGRMTSVEQQIKLPVDPRRLTTSSLVFGTQLAENSTPQFQISQPGKQRDERVAIPSPLRIRAKEIVPLTDRVFSRAEQFYVLFYAYHAKLDAVGKPRLKVSASIWDASGKKLSDAPPVTFTETDAASGGVPCHVRFTLRNFTPGKYLLKIDLADELSQEHAELEEGFEVK
ncbi:MAG TPA: VWA domain-containing protein [Acidobacteriota bacterium]|jgi:VWFA-related protein